MLHPSLHCVVHSRFPGRVVRSLRWKVLSPWRPTVTSIGRIGIQRPLHLQKWDSSERAMISRTRDACRGTERIMPICLLSSWVPGTSEPGRLRLATRADGHHGPAKGKVWLNLACCSS